jgi:hypothetical protein
MEGLVSHVASFPTLQNGEPLLLRHSLVILFRSGDGHGVDFFVTDALL